MEFIYAFQVKGEIRLVLAVSQEAAIEIINMELPRGITVAILNYVPLAAMRSLIWSTLGF